MRQQFSPSVVSTYSNLHNTNPIISDQLTRSWWSIQSYIPIRSIPKISVMLVVDSRRSNVLFWVHLRCNLSKIYTLWSLDYVHSDWCVWFVGTDTMTPVVRETCRIGILSETMTCSAYWYRTFLTLVPIHYIFGFVICRMIWEQYSFYKR